MTTIINGVTQMLNSHLNFIDLQDLSLINNRFASARITATELEYMPVYSLQQPVFYGTMTQLITVRDIITADGKTQ